MGATLARGQTTELSPLKRAYLALEQLQSRCRELEQSQAEPIAVVGIGCRLPGGADSPESYWQLLRDGVDAVGPMPAERRDALAHHDTKCTHDGGYLRERIDNFDPQFFGISPREAEIMDPQHRLLLEVAWEALEHAAQAEERSPGSDTGVFVGLTSHDYADLHLAQFDPARLGAHHITGNAHNAAAGRLSYCFGFRGPCLAVDTACSSSLVAVHLACQSLLQNECRRALAGGVNLILSALATIALSQGKVLAADGRCRAFDASASGMVRGEGCAVVVLKRLSHALEDGDNVLALVRASAVNQDGPSSGLTVPSGPAQEALIRQALARAGLQPGEIDYIEAHGTGTPLGDPIELRALAGVFGAGRDRPMIVGSVKTNIGHLEACAGVAGLIKIVLALQRQEIPAHLHFRTPTPHAAWNELPFLLPTEPRPWPAGSRPRLAGVSSFGFSGVNAHVVLQEAPPKASRQAAPGEADERPSHLLTLSGRSEQALRQLALRYADHLGSSGQELADVCFSAGAGRVHAAHRLGVVAGSTAEAREGLAAFLNGRRSGMVRHGGPSPAPKVAFLFTGQGSQYAGMGQGLYETEPVFRRAMQCCDEVLRAHLPRPLLEVLYGGAGGPSVLDDTGCAQPALFALGYALSETWRSWGIRPAVVLGHSVGEYVAACVAGVFGLEDGLRLVAARGRLMQALPRDGAMAAVLADPGAVEHAVKPFGEDIAVAAYNAPGSLVLSGRRQALSEACARLEAAGARVQPLRVSHAFHSPLMDPALDAFEAEVRKVPLAPPKIALVSNLTGGVVSDEVTAPAYWRRHLRQPVRFAQGVAAARARGCTAFLELGPAPTLLGLAQQVVEDSEVAWLPSLRPGQPDTRPMLESLAGLYVRGARVDWAGVDFGRPRRRLPLPTTPFARQRCWLPPAAPAEPSGGPDRGHPLLGVRLHLAGTAELRFQSRAGAGASAFLRDHVVFGEAVFPAAAYLEMALAAAGEAFGPDEAGADISLSQVSFEHALRLPADGSRTLQTVLRPDAADGYAFEIFSALDGLDPVWVRHAAGELHRLPAEEGAAPADPAALVAQATEAAEVDALYERARACGVELGPRFQALRRAWRNGTAALAEVALPDEMVPGAGEYRLHPVLLDGALQAMGAVFAGRDEFETLLPVALDHVRLHRSGEVAGWSQVRVEAVRGSTERSLRVDVELLGADGGRVATLEGLQLKSARRDQLQASAPSDFADWLYAVEWEAQDTLVAQGGPDYLPGGDEVRRVILPGLAATIGEPPELLGYSAFLERIEELSAGYAASGLAGLGWRARPGDRESTGPLAVRLGVAARHRRLFARLLGILGETGVLRRCGEDGWEVLAELDGCGAQAQAEALLLRYPEATAELTLLRRCAERLPDVLKGDVDPLVLLFPDGEEVTAACLYADSPGARAANAYVRDLVVALLARRPPNRPVRIIEIGAGTGATTAGLLPVLPGEHTEYTFTDVSPLFVHRAEQAFSDYPFVQFGVVDIERPPEGQGFAPGGYDLVIAANVLHATRDLREALGHAGQLLAPGGLLVLLEGTAQLRFIDLIFGLTEGWWRFADGDLRPAHPLLSADAWENLLRDRGFRHASALSAPPDAGGLWSTQALIVAEGTSAPAATEVWLILAPEGCPISQALLRRVVADGGTAVLAHPGVAYERLPGGALRIDPGDPDAFRRLVTESGAPPAKVVDLWPLSLGAEDDGPAGSEAAERLGWGAALHLVQALALAGAPAAVYFVTRGAQAVQDRDHLPGLMQSPLWGMARIAGLEQPGLECVRVDLDAGDAEQAAHALYEETRRDPAEDAVAFRAGRRYVARLARRRAGVAAGFRISSDATYLITGGWRGLGLETAQWLASLGARSLVLVGRSAVAEAEGRLTSLRRSGADIHTVQADVGDAGQMAAVFAHIEAHLPPLRGVIHSAGVLDDGVVAQQNVERFRGVLAAKAQGAWNLHRLTRGLPLDFFVLYSSLASFMGAPGQANHAAANAFLDALAHHRRGLGLPALSIDWGAWSGIGAAARRGVARRIETHGMGAISPSQGIRVLHHLLSANPVQAAVAPIDWRVFSRRARAERHPPFFARFASEAAMHAAAAPRPALAADLLHALRAAAPEERRREVAAYLRAQVADVLRLAPEEVDVDQPLNRMGLDSLMAVELRNRLRGQLGVDVPLVRFMEDASISGLSSELEPRLARPGADAEPNAPAEPALADPAALLAVLDRLTDAEVDALLGAELAAKARADVAGRVDA